MQPLHELNAREAAEAIASGAITSEALVAACLERITAREDEVGAWIEIDPASALAQARACDQTGPRGPLHGVPVGVKDIIDTADMPTAYGSPIYEDHWPVADAACVALVRAAGGVIMGKTVTTEFATYTPGKTANPHNTAHTPGGSSSGSAAAVGDGMVPLAFGSQTAGSVIRPASFCGAVGYKASHGELSLVGVKAISQTLDTLGIFSRAVADLALLRAALVGAPATVAAIDGPPRIGLCHTSDWPRAEEATQAALSAAAKALESAGAHVSEVTLPAAFDGLGDAQNGIMAFEGVRNFGYELQHHKDKLSQRFLDLMLPGADISYESYADALALAERCRAQLDDVFGQYDVLLTPSAPGEAPEGLAATGNPVFNRIWTLLHTPAISLPGQRGRNGLPVGVQLIGPINADDRLLSVAAWAEAQLS